MVAASTSWDVVECLCVVTPSEMSARARFFEPLLWDEKMSSLGAFDGRGLGRDVCGLEDAEERREERVELKVRLEADTAGSFFLLPLISFIYGLYKDDLEAMIAPAVR